MIYLAILGAFAFFWLGYGLGSLNTANRIVKQAEDVFGAVEGGSSIANHKNRLADAGGTNR